MSSPPSRAAKECDEHRKLLLHVHQTHDDFRRIAQLDRTRGWMCRVYRVPGFRVCGISPADFGTKPVQWMFKSIRQM